MRAISLHISLRPSPSEARAASRAASDAALEDATISDACAASLADAVANDEAVEWAVADTLAAEPTPMRCDSLAADLTAAVAASLALADVLHG